MTSANTNNSNTKKFPSDDDLTEFHLQIYSLARELQKMSSGLLSNSDAVRTATFEHFSKGLMAINCAMAHTKLFEGESGDEQVQAMVDYAATSSASATSREASNIVQNMLDTFSTEPIRSANL